MVQLMRNFSGSLCSKFGEDRFKIIEVLEIIESFECTDFDASRDRHSHTPTYARTHISDFIVCPISCIIYKKTVTILFNVV